jgi:hypothetical protein
MLQVGATGIEEEEEEEETVMREVRDTILWPEQVNNNIKVQFVPHRKHITSPLKIPTG